MWDILNYKGEVLESNRLQRESLDCPVPCNEEISLIVSANCRMLLGGREKEMMAGLSLLGYFLGYASYLTPGFLCSSLCSLCSLLSRAVAFL